MAKGNKHLCINKQNYFMLKKILQKHLNHAYKGNDPDQWMITRGQKVFG